MEDVWAAVLEHRGVLEREGLLESRRRAQNESWMWTLVDEGLHSALRSHPGVREVLAGLRDGVADGSLPATVAAARLLEAFGL